MKPIILNLLAQAHIMQLATSLNNQPWVCSVYFVYDDDLNLYWLSYPDRRHSRELAQNSQAAVTMAIKTDLPVIGLSAEGGVSIVEDETLVKQVMQRYVEKYGEGQTFYERFVEGTNKHMLYQLQPQRYIMFDEVNNSSGESRQEFELS